jgi:hypothetical protein
MRETIEGKRGDARRGVCGAGRGVKPHGQGTLRRESGIRDQERITDHFTHNTPKPLPNTTANCQIEYQCCLKVMPLSRKAVVSAKRPYHGIPVILSKCPYQKIHSRKSVSIRGSKKIVPHSLSEADAA